MTTKAEVKFYYAFDEVQAMLNGLLDPTDAELRRAAQERGCNFSNSCDIEVIKAWLRCYQKGLRKYHGYHDERTLPIRDKQTVTIPKGTPIRTTGNPKYKIAKRNYTVEVNYVSCGYNVPGWELGIGGDEGLKQFPRQNPSVVWAGTGGYWHEVDINFIPEAQ